MFLVNFGTSTASKWIEVRQHLTGHTKRIRSAFKSYRPSVFLWFGKTLPFTSLNLGLAKAMKKSAVFGRAKLQNGTGGRVTSSRLFSLARLYWFVLIASACCGKLGCLGSIVGVALGVCFGCGGVVCYFVRTCYLFVSPPFSFTAQCNPQFHPSISARVFYT